MLKVPDIQDIQDVTRFASGAWYPIKRTAEGDVTEVAKVLGVHGNTVLLHTASVTKDSVDIGESLLTFSDFLKLEQGYYKSRLVEFGGSIVYLHNTGASEISRNHSFRPEVIQFKHIHPDITTELQLKAWESQAAYGLSKRRTGSSTAIELLDSGEVVGCALSDNFGLVTLPNKDHIQIVRRDKVIGEVRGTYPQLRKGCEHYYNAVNKLWR